ncbi:uncharacterized protein LOC115330930 isoform X1 [Ixodes scapularis]|uniref:uncharacterized protein LOC115330930 isoform X1 n=1 Tax=Ixodes scapularis TaxID=6945 RepID=UPI001A9D74C1|nr:uncharacterized protein LOC115330930 isoform X1 [Ixodes scapularis]
MAAMFVRSQKVVSVGSSFRTSRFNILQWGDEAVFGAVNLERRSVVGQPCRRLKRAAQQRALTLDKLAAVGTILFGAASPATILRSNKSVSIQVISERTYNKCQTDFFDMYIGQAPSDVSPRKQKGFMNKYIAEQLQDIDRKLQF